MSELTSLPFIALLHGEAGASFEALFHRLAAVDVRLDSTTGEISSGETLVGFFEWYGPDEAKARYARHRWWGREDGPLWLPPRSGAIAWSHIIDPRRASDVFWPALLTQALPRFVRLMDGGIADAIIRRQFSLANIIGKHGFDDGVAIPRLNAGADEAFDAIEAAVTAVRLPGSLEWHESHHNPIRWSPKVPMDAEQKTRLAATHVEFWALNVPLLQDDAFWAE